MIFATPLAVALSLALTVPVTFAAVPILEPAELRPGQRAIVRTVFAGDSVESFAAEIVGVLKGARVDGDMILAKPVDDRVRHTGIAAGMSGSPVYVDGKLIGALAFGWAFSRDELFGITPIRSMLELLELPAAPDSASTGPAGADPALAARRARFAGFRWAGDESDEPEAPESRAGSEPRPLPLALSSSGLAPAAFQELERSLAPLGLAVTRGGEARGKPGSEAPLEAGSAVAVDVMRGDLRLAAIGTVTYRDGDRVLIFGHPFFQSGDVRLPLSRATITTIVASDQSSFKLGMPGETIGAVLQDRRAGVSGRLGASPRLMPISFRFQDAGQAARAFNFESVEDRALAPVLLTAALFNAALESAGANSSQTVTWEARLYRRGSPPLVLHDVAAGEASLGEFVNGVSGPLRFLLNNPFERLRLDSIAVSAKIVPGRALWTLRSARLDRAWAAPGSSVRVVCDLESWRGGHEQRTLEIEVPEEVPEGRYVLYLGGGAELSRFESVRLPARYRPASMAEAFARFGALRSSDGLYATIVARAPEITRDAHDYPELPLSALAMLGSGLGAGDVSRRGDSALLSETKLAVPGALRGEILLQLQVDARTP